MSATADPPLAYIETPFLRGALPTASASAPGRGLCGPRQTAQRLRIGQTPQRIRAQLQPLGDTLALKARLRGFENDHDIPPRLYDDAIPRLYGQVHMPPEHRDRATRKQINNPTKTGKKP
ncbi:hypothetical protein KO516_10695 [Citreicella sp. C3M06]|uniref:hypothetical protein n=1 Tax=Citreicella sp. C3M06 TaxID=2841564 RepID=UPI001C0821E8|nr:hypothetical protein [Citreicella sp. C3M06]MBU2961275.1 hypothetical protein [Citreicella sp. C3M06]